LKEKEKLPNEVRNHLLPIFGDRFSRQFGLFVRGD